MKKVSRTALWVGCAVGTVGAASLSLAGDAGVVKHMHEHFDAVTKIKQAVVAGSLEGTREPASYLVEHEAPDGIPADWAPYVDAMREAAQGVLDASDLMAAASATSELGLACGGCHSGNDVTVEFDMPPEPSDDSKTGAHMQRHQWAADRMWEGLIGPSRYAWSRGADLLFESPIKPAAMGEHGGDDAVVGMSRRIHQLGANASTVVDANDEAEIYAEFLGNCAACHSALKD